MTVQTGMADSHGRVTKHSPNAITYLHPRLYDLPPDLLRNMGNDDVSYVGKARVAQKYQTGS